MNQKVNEWVKRFIKNRAKKLEESTSKSQHKINLLIVEEVREYFEISISERTVARNLNVSQNVPRPSLQQLVADDVVRLLQERGAATRPVARQLTISQSTVARVAKKTMHPCKLVITNYVPPC